MTAASSRSLPQSRPVGPGVVYSAIGMVLLLFIATVALTTAPPSPPAIAEFAPQAVEQIKEAPAQQSSDFGSGDNGDDGGEAAPGSSTTTTAAPEVIDVARVRRCVGDPPRQIEDPQSPPCVPYWEGDNGGDTWQGVTENEIRIAVGEWNDRVHPLLETFFNTRFEFYGRQIRLMRLVPAGGEPEEQRATAAAADEELRVFASLSVGEGGGFHYHRELARRQIISTTHFPKGSNAEMTSLHPYLWQYPMAYDDIFSNVGEWACKRLVGGPAKHAGPPLNNVDRRFGIIVNQESEGETISPENLERELDRCGADRGPTLTIDGVIEPAVASTAVERMRRDGVTSIFCLCHVIFTSAIMRAATAQTYFPEWLISTYLLQDYNWALGLAPREQLDHTFGVSFVPKQIAPANEPSRWAMREADPTCCTGEDAPFRTNANIQYRQLLMIASGIQGAGPELTPETFGRALHTMAFPNPDHPNMEGKVGFSGAKHAMTIDGTEVWWSSSATSPSGDPGALCYVEGGRRYQRGGWPTGEGSFFATDCDSGAG